MRSASKPGKVAKKVRAAKPMKPARPPALTLTLMGNRIHHRDGVSVQDAVATRADGAAMRVLCIEAAAVVLDVDAAGALLYALYGWVGARRAQEREAREKKPSMTVEPSVEEPPR
jgi:hypothetical protein